MSLTVAFFTPSIHGHSNVHLTILRQLVAEAGQAGRPSLDIHVLGDEPLRSRIESLPQTAHASVTFHPLGKEDLFMTILPTLTSASDTEIQRGRPMSPFRSGGLDGIRTLIHILAPSPALYLPRYVRILEVLQKVKPALFVNDLLYGPLGADAARHGGFKHLFLSPACSLDAAFFNQPHGKAFWKYPMLVGPAALLFLR
jgi:hypothetical protein